MGYWQKTSRVHRESSVLPNRTQPMIYYLRLLATISDANYNEAYLDALAVSEWWISTLEAVTKR